MSFVYAIFGWDSIQKEANGCSIDIAGRSYYLKDSMILPYFMVWLFEAFYRSKKTWFEFSI